MELFALVIRLWRLQVQVGLDWLEADDEQERAEPAGPMPHLQPVDAPMEVVIDEFEDDEAIGFR